MKKTKKTPTTGYTDIQNLALSWLPGTDLKISTPNELVSVDWGIVNKKNIAKVNNIFAIYLDNYTGFVFVYPAESRGQAGPSFQAFIQRYGTPKTIIHDNAQEFIGGTFAQICTDKSIQHQPAPPYDHNKNPTEKYMDILTSMARCLLFISGLDRVRYWDHALLHAASLQNRTALIGRSTPYEGQFGRRPNVTHLRIFGCEALAYVEKEKRTKLDNKVERTIYLGMSQEHSDDTAKLLSLKTMKIIYRRNVYYNEKSFPARKLKFNPSLNLKDTGEDLLGLQFLDDDVWWTIKDHGTHDGHQVLFYVNNTNGQEEKSSVKEVRTWYNRTQLDQVSSALTQASNTILPTRKGYINAIAEASFKAIQQYDVKLPNKNAKKPTSFRKAGNMEQPQWFQAELKEKDGMMNFVSLILI
jgi:hypothetical protein